MATLDLEVAIVVQDSKGAETSIPVYGTVSDASTIANLFTGVEAFVKLVDAVLGGAITKVGVKILANTSTWSLKGSAVAGSQLSDNGQFTFFPTAGTKSVAQALPAFNVAKLTSGKYEINTADTDVAAFIAALTGGSTPITWTSNDWSEFFDAIKKARLTTRKHRKQMARN